MATLPDGGTVEIFGARSEHNGHFDSGPVAGFLVEDVAAAGAELRAAGVEILLQSAVDESGNAWVHFQAPDGNIYEFTQDPGFTRPAWRTPTSPGRGARPTGLQRSRHSRTAA